MGDNKNTLKTAIFASGIALFITGCYTSLYGVMNLTINVVGLGVIVLGWVMIRVVDKEKL